MPTRADLIEKVAEDLGVKAVGQTLSSADSAFIGERYDEVLEEFKGAGFATWTSSDIPSAVMPGLRKVVAFEAGPAFGRPLPYEARLLGERMIRRQTVYRDNGEPARATYY